MAVNGRITIQVCLTGSRPIMFDRYAGDNSTQLPTAERMYLDKNQGLVIPAINLFSLLCAENSKSVCKFFFGKSGKTIAIGIGGYVNIDPFDIPLLGEADKQIHFSGWDDKIKEHKAVARLAKGVPNPKTRPMVELPWSVKFNVSYVENEYCSINNLRQAFEMGGTLGLGTFRPFFGSYNLSGWSEVKN